MEIAQVPNGAIGPQSTATVIIFDQDSKYWWQLCEYAINAMCDIYCVIICLRDKCDV